MAYSALSDSQIDGDSPLIADTFFKLRDNPIAIANGDSGAPRIQTAALQDNCVTGAKVAAFALGYLHMQNGAVPQNVLATSEGYVTINGDISGHSTSVLPGGQYGFYPQFQRGGTTNSGAHSWVVQFVGGIVDSEGLAIDGYNPSTSRTTYISMYNDTGGFGFSPDPTLTAYQRYINASPPYNLGDGDIPLFVFVRTDNAGKIKATYVADVPPWAYNGPTSVCPDRLCKITGRKFQTVRRLNKNTGEIDRFEREITHDIKNADMELIPHPFMGGDSGDKIVLLDPCATEKLYEIHQAGESISELLNDDYLRLGNELHRCKSSPGVMPVSFRFRNSR